MSTDPVYRTTAALAAAAGVSLRTFFNHVKANVGGIQAAKDEVKGLGDRWHIRKSQKYIDLVTAEKAPSRAKSP